MGQIQQAINQMTSSTLGAAVGIKAAEMAKQQKIATETQKQIANQEAELQKQIAEKEAQTQREGQIKDLVLEGNKVSSEIEAQKSAAKIEARKIKAAKENLKDEEVFQQIDVSQASGKDFLGYAERDPENKLWQNQLKLQSKHFDIKTQELALKNLKRETVGKQASLKRIEERVDQLRRGGKR